MENAENIQNLTAKDIEELVLGTILTFRGVLQENASMLNEELFFTPVCKILFKETAGAGKAHGADLPRSRIHSRNGGYCRHNRGGASLRKE